MAGVVIRALTADHVVYLTKQWRYTAESSLGQRTHAFGGAPGDGLAVPERAANQIDRYALRNSRIDRRSV